ncbi:MAG: hypothetical protein OEW48_03265 [Phycisphaerae bacterium]|nr:hypothetical protein [Phycisphaerae bacterium]
MKKLKIIFIIFAAGLSAAQARAVLALSVDLGTTVGEAGYTLTNWGPVEPTTHPGGWGGIASDPASYDKRCRTAWGYVENTKDASITFPTKIVSVTVRHLDGLSNDSFRVEVDGNLWGSYSAVSGVGEFWTVSSFSGTPGTILTITCTGPAGQYFNPYGQVGIDRVEAIPISEPVTYYIDASVSPGGDGRSWMKAFNRLKDALAFASSGDEIRVAQGLYSPEDPLSDIRRARNPNPADGAKSVSRTADLSWTAGSDATSHDVYFGTTRPGVFQGNQSGMIFDPGTMAYYTTYYWRIDEISNEGKTIGTVWTFTTLSSPPPPPPLADSNEQAAPAVVDRTATFQLINGVVIKGGYAGFGEPNADARDIEVYKTILSGDIGIPGNSSDNSFHVVTGAGTDETAVLDGFTITAGNANENYPSPYANGGGMYNYSGSPTLINCTFIGNSAVRDGGGMFNGGQSNPTLTGCIFRGNSSIYEGGAISNRTSSPTITNCSFIDNSSNHGGGISSWPGSPVVSDSTFSSNSAELGGAVFNYDSISTLTNCIFSYNYAEEVGGAICNLSTAVPLVQDNSGSLGGGTNIAKSIPLFADYTFGDNSSDYESSVNSASDSSTLVNCTFSDNFANAGGGVCYIGESNPSLDNCTFGGNSAQIGGGFVISQCTVILTDCTFRGNSGEWGGAFYSEISSADLINCIFSLNTSSYAGAAMHEAISSSSLYNCLFNGNTSNLFGGAMYYWYESSPQLFNCTFTGNSALVGNAIVCAVPEGYYPPPPPSNIRALNCIFWNGGNEIANWDNSIITVTYSDVQNGYFGTGNINANPLFMDSAIGDYYLLPNSPCINTGDPDYIAEPDETDMDGKPRIIGARIDMGAYEFNHNPVADAGPDRAVEAQGHWGATVTLDGSGSSDADSTHGTIDDINDFNWYEIDPCDPNADVFLGNGRIVDCNLPIGEHIILLEVIDKAGASDTNEVTIIVQDTTPPDINCPPNVTLECPADTTPIATGKATATDTCGTVTITHSDQWQPNCGNAGTLARTWIAADECGNSSSCVQIITVVDTTPPAITCPADVTLQCPADTSVEANGSATAGDTCSSVAITHSDLWQPGCGNTGILTRTWTATDDCGNSSSCLQTITVVDTTPPEFEFSVAPTMLWPPDHKMVEITPSWTVSDECDATPDVSLVSIVANEGDDTIGDGHTTDDIQINEDGSIYLRSERSGTGNDRIYTITYQAVDDCGNAAVRSDTVSIPHDFKVLVRIASRWLWAGPAGRIPEDLNGDGFVNLKDIAIFANNWIQ